MRTFRCPKCGYTEDQPVALQEWHRCGGREREMRLVERDDSSTPVALPDPAFKQTSFSFK